MSQSIAKLRSARVSSQKARLVANQIRGKKVEEAMGILTFAPQKSAHIIKKILESAIANAEHNKDLDVDTFIFLGSKQHLRNKSVTLTRMPENGI